MSNDASVETVQRLLTAYKRTRETLEAEPVTWELHPGTDAARTRRSWFPYLTQLRAGDYSQGSRNRRRRYGIYGRSQSLHSYIAIRRADQSSHPIAGRQGVGFERRLYTRIEDKPLLRNSPEALAAVWGVCVQVAEELALSRFPEHIDSEHDHALWP